MALDERQKVVKRTFTKEQLEKMSMDDLVALVGEAQAKGGKFMGKAVVRRADGSIKLDNPELAKEFEDS
jgi:hypothetical protein